MNHHKFFTSDMIHTIVEGLFQQLSTVFVAATGKRHWSSTSQRDQTSRHSSTSSSHLASCLSFNRDVITTREKHSSFTKAYEIPRTFNCLDYSQNNMRYCHKLDAQPMGDLFSRLGTSSQDVARPTSNSFPEQPVLTAKASSGQAAGSSALNHTLKHNSPMMSSSCLGARCSLLYGKIAWPLYSSYRKACENEKWRVT